MGNHAWRREAFLDSFGNSSNGPLVKLQIANPSRYLIAFKDALSFEVGDGSVVLVDTGQHDSVRRGSSHFGQSNLPAAVGVIANLTPVHCREHDRFAGP